MANTLCEALLVLTSWNTASDDLISQPTRTLVKDFSENTLKSDEVSKLYCTILDVEVSEDQKKDAESVGVTLIPATRFKWSDPEGDPPVPNWLLHHHTYYPGLRKLQHIKHVVSFSSKTKNAAAAIHGSLFPQAQLHQLSAPDSPASALLVHTTWDKDPESIAALTTQVIIKDIKENTLNSAMIGRLFCTVFDTEINEDQNRNAESIGVTLIPATNINSGDIKDPPGETWLVHHESRYPTLGKLQNIKHVISLSSRTKAAAAFVHQNIFTSAKLHHVTPPGVLFAFDVWDKNGCGLTGYHRTVIQDFCARKIVAGEPLIAYSTVLTIRLTDEQIEDADKCNVTLINAHRKSGVSDSPNIQWLLNHESYYPDLGKLDNIKYVVGYAPKTGWAAIDIRKKMFPEAKLVLINHACQELNCLLENNANDSKESTLENEMLEMASEADILFSVGPLIYEYFENAYKANCNGKELSDIPHVEIFPKSRAIFIDSVNKKTVDTYSVLTYGQFSAPKAWKQCETLATPIGTAGRNLQMLQEKPFEWKLHGISKEAIKVEGESLKEEMKQSHVNLKLYSASPAPTLLRSIQQSNLCLPPSCYTDYSFEGLEAMAAGLPTTVQGDSHIAYMIRKYLNKWKEYCLLNPEDTMAEKIVKRLRQSDTAFTQAEELKVALKESRIFTEMLGEFTSFLTERGKTTTGKSGETGFLRKAEQGKGNNGEGSGQMKSKTRGAENATTLINQHKPPSPDNMDKGEEKDSDVFTIHVKLVEESYQDKMKQLDEQKQTGNVLEQKKTLHAAWEKLQEEVHENANTMISAEDARLILTRMVKKHFGEGTLLINWEAGSFKISLNIPNQYHLYRVKHSCRSGSFPDSFEPLLIADKIREEADKVGLELKLKATYDQARFDKLRLFFINRDGGGLAPAKVSDDVIEGKDAEEIQIDDEDTDQKSDTTVTGGVADRTPTEHRQSLEDIQTKLDMERATLESQLKEAKEEKATLEERCKELTQKLESTKQSMVSQRMDNSAKQKALQSELEEKKKLINELEDKLEQSEQGKSGEKGDGGKLDPVEVFDDVIEGKDVEEIHVDDEETDQKSKKMMTGRVDSSSEGQSLEDIQSTPEMERTTLESQLKETKEEKATLEEGRKELTQKLESTKQSLVSQRIALFSQRIGKSTEREKLQSELEEKEKLTKKLDNTVEEFKHNLEHSSQKKQAEKAQTSMPQRPPQHHHEMSTGHMMQASAATGPLTTPVVYSQAQQMPYQTDQSHTQGTITSQMIPQKVENQSNIQSTQKPQIYISTPQGHLTPPHHQGQNLIPQEIRSSTTQVYAFKDIKNKLEMERATLQSQLKEAKEEKSTLEERCKELTQKLESTEPSLVSQRTDTSVKQKTLQSELKEKTKLINKLEDKVGELENKLEQSEQQKSGEKALEDIQSTPEMERTTLESQLKETKEEKATLEEGRKELTQKLERTEQSLVSQRIALFSQHIGKSMEREKLQSELEEKEKLTKKLDNTVEEFKHNLEHSSQKKQAEKAQTSMPQQPPQHHHEMSAGHMMQASAATVPPTSPLVYAKAQQMPYPTGQSHTQGTLPGQMIPQKEENQYNIQSTQKPKKYRSSPQGHLTSPHHQGKNPIPQEIQTSATQVSGDWSVTLVNGQHQGQGQKFKLPNGLAFHGDKLVVCDSGNNIVQILNKDYTCDKVIGSFDGQFAKPFWPTRVAISRFNHYFIFDYENKQIVVCDENGKIIKIITLPENIEGVWDIALMDDFVLVTLSLTSLDITRREDRDDRLVKYTQSGEYVTDVGGQTSVKTKFYYPHSVAVNSKNVIMVYDNGNGCIKCFDSDLNFLHQFGQSQLQTPRIGGRGYIAVDEDDNVYICGYVRVKSTGDVIREWIVKYGCDEKFICDLFKGFVSRPWYIAVMGDKIGVVEYRSDQIKVFSK